ncbi:hypothetical protein [Microcoleus asticus]|uniref:hypothetical protein n=1 Tax=Microcoleus asticus TaxID=2815231 RepID=UPI001FE6CC10|nr:hypothetical protein [Microcoleus asticus]
MTILTQVEPVEIEYPSSDGEPMAESDITRDYMIYSVEAVKLYFQERSDVYVSANSFIYYEEGNNQAQLWPRMFMWCLELPTAKGIIIKFGKKGELLQILY